VLVAIVTLAGVSVLASQSSSHPLKPADAQHALRWQGPFTYVKDFGSSGSGCVYHGHETVNATLSCTGSDLMHLRCTASGTADHFYAESIGDGPNHSRRTDTGSYHGALDAAYDAQTLKGYELFRLDVGTTLPVQYRQESAPDVTRQGTYRLDVDGGIDYVPFEPASSRIERRKTVPIYQPGPAACASAGRFNGTETVSMRLLPAD